MEKIENQEEETSNEQFRPQGISSPINAHNSKKDSTSKQGMKDNIMKMIRKRLNETKTDSKKSKGDKYIPTDMHNIYTGERLAVPVQKIGKNDSKSIVSVSDDSTPDKKANQKEVKESTKTAKFLD